MADATTIISRLSARFKNSLVERDKPDFLTRDIGGHFRTNQPYISGYFQVIFGLPQKLFGDDADNVKTASQWLHSTAEGFTPHTQTLNKVDIMGQGQIGSSYVASVTTTREFTLTFREYQNMPILNIIKNWAAVFDPFVGVSPLGGKEFIPVNYKGWCAVLQTKPVRGNGESLKVEDVEECYIYQGVFPTNIPVDTASASDITGNDTVQLSVTFSFDGAPLTSAEPGVSDKVVSLFNDLKYMGAEDTTFGRYSKLDKFAPWGANAGSSNAKASS